MRTSMTLVAVGLALLAAACVTPVSLNPLFISEKDLVFEPALVGTWQPPGEKDKVSCTFLKKGYNAYELIWVEGGDPRMFNAHLVRLGGFLFLDAYPEEPSINNGTYRIHLVPVHTFSRIWVEGDVLRLAPLNEDWLKEMTGQKKVTLSQADTEDQIVLTASTAELQDFVVKHAEDPKAFEVKLEFHRQK